jgi:hypothetical protein
MECFDDGGGPGTFKETRQALNRTEQKNNKTM